MISLPVMNNICKRWNLPAFLQSKADLYFLRNYSDAEFSKLVHTIPERDAAIFISEYGVAFQVIFMGEAMATYVSNGEKEKRNEPNSTFYWCSFRSISFEFAGKTQVKSYVLVQVDRKGEEFQGKAPEKRKERIEPKRGALAQSLPGSTSSPNSTKLPNSKSSSNKFTNKFTNKFMRNFLSVADAHEFHENLKELKELKREVD